LGKLHLYLDLRAVLDKCRGSRPVAASLFFLGFVTDNDYKSLLSLSLAELWGQMSHVIAELLCCIACGTDCNIAWTESLTSHLIPKNIKFKIYKTIIEELSSKTDI
jgi:hypothetical protein